jgi:hypothetical protein
MSLTTTTRRRWTEPTIDAELRTQCAQLGHFPTRAELVARGLRGLWDAMRSSGGVETWRERLSIERPEITPQDIANLAYELYERGTPGDATAHWLAAEQQLFASSQ